MSRASVKLLAVRLGPTLAIHSLEPPCKEAHTHNMSGVLTRDGETGSGEHHVGREWHRIICLRTEAAGEPTLRYHA